MVPSIIDVWGYDRDEYKYIEDNIIIIIKRGRMNV